MGYPLTITRDSASAKLYRTVKPDGYKTYCLCWYEDGERKRRTFTDREEALSEADRLLTQILAGTPILATMRESEVKEYAAACELIKDTGLPLVTVCREFMRTWKPGFKQETVAKLVARYQKEHESDSPRHRKDLKYRLNAFRRQFGKRFIDEIPGPEVREFIDGRKFKGKPAANRTKANWLRLLKGLWNFARDCQHLVKDRRHELEDLRGWKFQGASYSLMCTGDLIVLHEACYNHKGRDQLLPYLALLAWGGLRVAEAKRLTYEDLVVRDEQVVAINVNAHQAKTKTRRSIDALPSLASFLHEFAVARHFKGKIAKWSKIDHILVRIAKEEQLGWAHNQIRHTFATHLLRQWNDPAKVAAYLGTSPHMLDSHYRELTTPDETEWWMGLREENPVPIQPPTVDPNTFPF